MELLWPSEQVLSLPVADGFTADTRLMGSLDGQHVVIMAHGLTSSYDRTLSFAIACALRQTGLNVLRLNFYSEGTGRRRLVESTLTTHAADLDALVSYVRQQGAQRITVLGHSLGGLTILLSPSQAFDDAVLLEASHPAVSPFAKATWNNQLDRYVYTSKGIDYLLGRGLVDGFTNLKPLAYTQNYHRPSLLVTGGVGPLVQQHAEYLRLLKPYCLIEQTVIPQASHTFDSPNARRQLIQALIAHLAPSHQSASHI